MAETAGNETNVTNGIAAQGSEKEPTTAGRRTRVAPRSPSAACGGATTYPGPASTRRARTTSPLARRSDTTRATSAGGVGGRG